MQQKRIQVADSLGKILEVIETRELIPAGTAQHPKALMLGKPSYRLSSGEALTVAGVGAWTLVSTGERLIEI